jgi:hypothetical protein
MGRPKRVFKKKRSTRETGGCVFILHTPKLVSIKLLEKVWM